MIGLRDDRLNDRCNGCKKKNKELQEWRDRYRENYHYCIATCIRQHLDCPRDNPEIKQRIKEMTTAKMRQTYLPSCRCETRHVILIDGVLRCGECMGTYGTAGSYNYTDLFLNDCIAMAPHISSVEKIRDATTGGEVGAVTEIVVTNHLMEDIYVQLKDHPEIEISQGENRFFAIGRFIEDFGDKIGIKITHITEEK